MAIGAVDLNNTYPLREAAFTRGKVPLTGEEATGMVTSGKVSSTGKEAWEKAVAGYENQKSPVQGLGIQPKETQKVNPFQGTVPVSGEYSHLGSDFYSSLARCNLDPNMSNIPCQPCVNMALGKSGAIAQKGGKAGAYLNTCA